RCEQFCLVWRASFGFAQDRLRSRPAILNGPDLQLRQLCPRCARQAIIRLANLLQRCDDKIKSRAMHVKRSSKILRSAANSLRVARASRLARILASETHALPSSALCGERPQNDAHVFLICDKIESAMSIRLIDYDYDLPRELIAQRPIEDRADSRMMVLHRGVQTVEHRQFRE